VLAAVFWLLLAVFLVTVSQFCIPVIRELLRGSSLFLLPFAVFSLLGAALIFLTLKERVRGMLKKFLILTGASAAGFSAGVALHNFFYALGVITEHIAALLIRAWVANTEPCVDMSCAPTRGVILSDRRERRIPFQLP